MKNISLNFKILLILLILYLITYNYFLSIGINSVIYNILFWGVFLILSYFLIGYTKNKAITKKQTMQYVVIYCIIYLLLIYFLGIITGFYYSPFLHDIKSLFINIVPLSLIIIFKEIVRYMFIFKGRFNRKIIIFVTILFILLDIVMVINMYQFNTILLIFTFIGEVCIRSIYNNSLQSIICYNTGPIPSIIYRVILDCYVYLVPIIPDIGVYLTIIINIVLPVLLLLKLNKLHFNYKNISKKKVGISKKYITIPVSIIFVIMVSLVSGIFKYKVIAVASNSMLPSFARGDAIIYEKVSSAKELKEGDILVFTNDDVIYIHRIVEIYNKNKEVIIYTKGDNNTLNDDFTTSEKEIIGKVVQEVKYIGYPTIWISELFRR